MEGVAVISHQNYGYAEIPVHTDLKQGEVLPLGP